MDAFLFWAAPQVTLFGAYVLNFETHTTRSQMTIDRVQEEVKNLSLLSLPP